MKRRTDPRRGLGRQALAVWLAAVTLASAWPAAVPTAVAAARPDLAAREAELRATETAFAATMADRDLAAFGRFLAADAIFCGSGSPLRGREAVLAGWSRFFAGGPAPFSWQPEEVVVLASGELGLSSGPVHDPAGNRIGTFVSTWRREADGAWRIVLDRGCPPCD